MGRHTAPKLLLPVGQGSGLNFASLQESGVAKSSTSFMARVKARIITSAVWQVTLQCDQSINHSVLLTKG